MSSKPLIYGHRGASQERPENTLESYRLALAQGADALELDVHLTIDEHVVVSHDDNGRRMAHVPRELRRSTLAEVRTWDAGFGFQDASGDRPFLGQGFFVPTLEEVLLAFPGVPLNVDIKQRDPPMEAALVALLRRHDAEGRVLIASFFDDVLGRVRALGYRGPTAIGPKHLRRLVATPVGLLRRGLPSVRGDVAQVPTRYGPVRFASRAFIDKCHALGKRVDFWTVNDEAEARALAAYGADGIMTDAPGRIVRALSRAKREE